MAEIEPKSKDWPLFSHKVATAVPAEATEASVKFSGGASQGDFHDQPMLVPAPARPGQPAAHTAPGSGQTGPRPVQHWVSQSARAFLSDSKLSAELPANH
jgi:hypothetical protein